MKNTIIGVIIGVLVALAVGFFFGKSIVLTAGAASTPDPNTPTQLRNLNLIASSTLQVGVPDFYPPDAPPFGPAICLGGNLGTTTQMCTMVTTGYFARSTTTMAIIPNPFAATSTVTFASIEGANSTTTIDILVGTTTLTTSQSITNNSQVSGTLINAVAIATSTQYYSVAGAKAGPGTGYTSPGANSYNYIVVGPNENIGILATSTNAAFALGNSGPLFPTATTTGTYSIRWEKLVK